MQRELTTLPPAAVTAPSIEPSAAAAFACPAFSSASFAASLAFSSANLAAWRPLSSAILAASAALALPRESSPPPIDSSAAAPSFLFSSAVSFSALLRTSSAGLSPCTGSTRLKVCAAPTAAVQFSSAAARNTLLFSAIAEMMVSVLSVVGMLPVSSPMPFVSRVASHAAIAAASAGVAAAACSTSAAVTAASAGDSLSSVTAASCSSGTGFGAGAAAVASSGGGVSP